MRVLALSSLLLCHHLLGCNGPRGSAADAPPRVVEPSRPSSTQASASRGSGAGPSRQVHDAGALADAIADAGETDRREPLTAPAALAELVVDGFQPAVVSLPLGTRSPRPVVVATHGNYDRPEWQCEQWRAIVLGQAFVLCPRGEARSDSPSPDDIRFTYRSNQKLEQELDAGLAALMKRYPDHVAEGPVLYTGFSLGAIMGVIIAARRPSRYPRLVLIEGGYDRWTAARARAFTDGGGRHVLFVCGQKGCELAANSAAKRLERKGVTTRVELVPRQGHSYGGPMNAPIRQAWDWLLAGDERWQKPAR